ncbi:MAG: hypothetical protein N2440_04585, partial [Actinobacteria bacterium]|nr:hypothetical protein [Actinomycetota bacterium]
MKNKDFKNNEDDINSGKEKNSLPSSSKKKGKNKDSPFFNPANLLLGITLILFGLSSFGKVTGYFYFDLSLLRIWPVFIVVLGLDIFYQNSFPVKLFSYFVLILSLALITAFTVEDTYNIRIFQEFLSKTSVPVDSRASRIRLKVYLPASSLKIVSQNKPVIEFSSQPSNRLLAISSSIDESSKIQEVKIEENSERVFAVNALNSDIVLPDNPTYLIFIKTAFSDLSLNFKKIELEKLEIVSQASKVKIDLNYKNHIQEIILRGSANYFEI